MSEAPMAPIRTWLAAPMDHDVSEAIQRLRRAPDVQQIAVMPDVHLSADVCIGVVVATSNLIYPQAVGGDIGCGMLAVGLDLEAAALNMPRVAGQILTDLCRAVPARRRNRREIVPQPEELASAKLSHPSLESVLRSEGSAAEITLLRFRRTRMAGSGSWCTAGHGRLVRRSRTTILRVRKPWKIGFACSTPNPTRVPNIFTMPPTPGVLPTRPGGQWRPRLAGCWPGRWERTSAGRRR